MSNFGVKLLINFSFYLKSHLSKINLELIINMAYDKSQKELSDNRMQITV